MLKKSVTYTNFNDQEVTEDFFFHISRAELVEMQMGHNDTYEKDGETFTGYQAKLQRIIDTEDGAVIMAEFKNLILNSYGQKSADGKRFVKSQELRDEFLSSEAYSTLFMELCTQADKAAEFVSGIIPRGIAEEAAKITDKPDTPKPLEAPRGVRGDGDQNVFEENESGPATTPAPGQPRVLTRAEITEMDTEELSHLLATGQAVIGQQD